jgi:EmrB/QacA subfamily drug resistance transporter
MSEIISAKIAYPSGKAYKLAMAVVLMGLFMAVLDAMIVSIALPGITEYFGNDVSRSQWVVTSYLVTITALLLLFGKLSSITGLKRMFLAGLAVFTVCSLGCGLATSLEMLVFFRILQAIGAAMTSSISMALVYLLNPPERHGKAMGMLGATIGVASMAGPCLGGLLLGYFDWRAIFLINVPIGVIALMTGIPCLNVTDISNLRNDKAGIDRVGAIALIAGLGSFMVFLNVAFGAADPALAYVTGGIALLSAVVFLWNEKRHPNPIIDPGIFRIRDFSLSLISMILFFIAVYMLNIIAPFYLEDIMGLTSVQIGMVLVVVPLIFVIGAPVSGGLYDRGRWKHFTATGLVVAFAGLVVCAWAMLHADFLLLIGSFCLFAIGYALFQTPNNAEIMRGLPHEKSPIASSVANTGRHLGMTLGAVIASGMLSLQGVIPGLFGDFGQGLQALALVSGVTVFMAAVLCIIAAWPSFVRNRKL